MIKEKREKRPVHGVILLNKPSGITSNAALQAVKNIFRAEKAGHTGSLDPLATGMLPICLGEATKFAGFFLNHDKTYEVCAVLGSKTDTADSAGTIIEEKAVPDISEATLLPVLESFLGEIMQVPPMYSALKVQGKRLHELARKGIEVERKARPVTIHRLTLDSIENVEGKTALRLTVACSKGTYIRTLVEDIAERLGTVGHVHTLHRTELAHFKAESMMTLEQLHQAKAEGEALLESRLLPMTEILGPEWPLITLDKNTVYYFQQGQAVSTANAPEGGLVQVCDEAGRFLGIGEMTDPNRLSPKRLIAVQA